MDCHREGFPGVRFSPYKLGEAVFRNLAQNFVLNFLIKIVVFHKGWNRSEKFGSGLERGQRRIREGDRVGNGSR